MVSGEFFLLERKCSPYTENNIILGIFDTEGKAEEARARYISEMQVTDPHYRQGYMTVNLEEDVSVDIIDVESPEEDKKKIFLLLKEMECMGQGFIEKVFASFSEKETETKFEEALGTVEGERFNTTYLIDELNVNELRYENRFGF